MEDEIVVTKLLVDNRIHLFKEKSYPRTAVCGQALNKEEEAIAPGDNDLFCGACLPFLTQWMKSGSQ